ncbi:MAG: ATP-dependent sacrificial sulfur transferase LarE [Asgard group archaeon]|nr:ATP-dependent sacrificial sulfur transferase LarE [Asgard group archaeon]
MTSPQKKLERLQEIILSMDAVIIAFSGGVDSTFLAKTAFDVLKEKAIAITIASPQLPPHEINESKEIAKDIGIQHIVLDGSKLDASWFKTNPKNRCYICKKEVLSYILDYCNEHDIAGQLIEGSNFDDLDDYRPGHQAVKELNVKSPLVEAKLTKADIRLLLKELDVDCWDKPASPCLATRFFFGEEITIEKMMQVYRSENYLKDLGIKHVRVRVQGNLARIETDEKYFQLIIDHKIDVLKELKENGFEFVTLDLAGYKKGSMNKPKN